jgi:hypothetical protein
VHLWINDESYGDTNPDQNCGGDGDTASQTGGVFDYTPAQLAAHDTTISDVLAYPNITGRPGFGGIFVENDQPTTVTAATVTLTGLAATYTGSPISAGATTNPPGLTVSFTYNGSATAPTVVGSYTVKGAITSPGYTGSATGTLVISKATPVINWPAPASLPAPATLTGTQLDATATNGAVTVAGAYVYTPPSGTVYTTPGVESLKVQFTPTDTTDYNTPPAAAQSLTVTAAGANPRVVWVPDFAAQTLQVEIGTGATAKDVVVGLPASCYPNAVTVNSSKAYVICTANGAAPDEVLVYNATTIHNAAAGPLTIAPTQTITSNQFNALITGTFDGSNNLWLSSYANGQIESISAAQLIAANPTVTVNISNSAASLLGPGTGFSNGPAGITFDTNGSLWVASQNFGGILLNYPSSQLTKGANAVPDFCMATTDVENGVNSPCQASTNVFQNPEGVALFGGDVWVANNSALTGNGATPGASIVDLKYVAGVGANPGTLTVNATYGTVGNTAKSPFRCPGGLFGGSVHLWVNDESYGEANPQCGANGDTGAGVGGILDFTAAQLAAEPVTVTPAYTNITSRPGYGGIFVENDQ